MPIDQSLEDRRVERQEERTTLLNNSTKLSAGEHQITVVEVLFKDSFHLDGTDSEVVVLDNEDRTLFLHENMLPFASRHDVLEGMTLILNVS